MTGSAPIDSRSNLDGQSLLSPSAEANPLRYDLRPSGDNEVSQLLLQHIPERSRVLDVGCGTGALACAIRDTRNASVIGLEPNPDRASASSKRGITTYCAVLSEDLLNNFGRVDVVLFADVLEHIPDPAQPLSLATKFLAPGGIVIASVPNVAHWSVRWNLLWGKFDYRPLGLMDTTHLRWFTRTSFGALFERAGYRVCSMTMSGGAHSEG